MIRSVNIQRFLNIESLELAFEDQVNILIGAARSGVSALPDAIEYALSGLCRGMTKKTAAVELMNRNVDWPEQLFQVEVNGSYGEPPTEFSARTTQRNRTSFENPWPTNVVNICMNPGMFGLGSWGLSSHNILAKTIRELDLDAGEGLEFNDSLAAALAIDARVHKNGKYLINGRPAFLASTTERWAWGVLFGELLCRKTGCCVFGIDGAEMLAGPAKLRLMNWLLSPPEYLGTIFVTVRGEFPDGPPRYKPAPGMSRWFCVGPGQFDRVDVD